MQDQNATATETATATATAPGYATPLRFALPSRIGAIAADDAHRYAMNSVLVHRPFRSPAAYATATNGRALAIVRVDPEAHNLHENHTYQIPAPACDIRAKAKGPMPTIVATGETVTSEGKALGPSDQSLPFPPVAGLWKMPETSARFARVALNPELLEKLHRAMKPHRDSTGSVVELAFEIDDAGNAKGRAILVRGYAESVGMVMPCALNDEKTDARTAAATIVGKARRIMAGETP
jgi:hypothetical protein